MSKEKYCTLEDLEVALDHASWQAAWEKWKHGEGSPEYAKARERVAEIRAAIDKLHEVVS